MSEYLTQRAIDALFAGGGVTELRREPEPRPFALRSARGFSRLQQQSLETALGGTAEALQTFFTFRLHRQIKFSLVTVEPVRRSDFLLSLPAPCAAFEFRLRSGSEERGLLDLGAPFVLYCVDCMLGGPGGAAAGERRLTRIEQEIARRVAGQVLARVGESLSEWLELAPAIVSFETNPEMIPAGSEEEPLLAVLLEVTDDAFSGLIALALPPSVLRALTETGTASPEERRSGAGPEASPGDLEQNLRLARVDLSVRLPSFGLSARAIARLQEGDVIDTGHRSDVPFELCVHGKPTYVGPLGQTQRRLALKIAGRAAELSGERREPEGKGRVL